MADALRVLVHNDVVEPMLDTLRRRVPQVVAEGCDSFDGMPDAVARFRPDVVYTVRFDGGAPYPREALFGADGPRWVANGGAGTDHFGHWDTDRVTVTNAAGVAADMMAEYVIGCFLHFTLDIPGLQADKSARFWDKRRMVRPLQGKTLLIVGLGHTGQAVAARAAAFGMHVIGTRARPQPMDNVDEVHGSDGLAALIPRADFIAVATPLTPATRGLIGTIEVAAMKPGVIIADVSRGRVMDPDAVLAAVTSGQIGGAALDVFPVEPLPADSPFWAAENVIISPHSSSVYVEWAEASFDLFLRNLDGWIAGKPLFNVVDPGRGY
jgi:phosphoglycerate dehydrogenase-like enzyme